MTTTRLVLQILALICFLLSALDVRNMSPQRLTAAGLFLWVLASMVAGT